MFDIFMVVIILTAGLLILFAIFAMAAFCIGLPFFMWDSGKAGRIALPIVPFVWTLAAWLAINAGFPAVMWLADRPEVSFAKKSTEVHVKNDVFQFKLIKITSPKHVYVTLERNGVETQWYVSKHCGRWNDSKLGDMVNLPVEIYKPSSDESERYRVIGLYRAFCS